MLNNLFGKKEPKEVKPAKPGRPGTADLGRPFLVNDHPDYQFSDLAKMPETQLVMLLPRQPWAHLAGYIQENEDVALTGRFGAKPGEYEWEWVPSPEGVRWWRRASDGSAALFGLALAVPRQDVVELYGLVEVDENSPFWPEVIPEEAANGMPSQAKSLARETGRPEDDLLAELYRDYFRYKKMLTLDEPGQPALRRGTIREVERFRNAFWGLVERATKAGTPSSM